MPKPIIGIGSTTAGLGGYTPQVNRTGFTEIREKKLFLSQREIALILPKTFRGGYGELAAGTVMAVDTNSNTLVPYIPDTINLVADMGRIDLVTDCNTATSFLIWVEESGKIKAGDVIVLTDSDGTYEEKTVSTIAVYDEKRSTVTLTAATTGNFEVSKSANCYLKAGTTGKLSVAKYILDQDIFTGTHENPNGALGSVFISNGVLYKNSCVGLDGTAITALGGIDETLHVIFK